jgi:Tfp pilus assembly protein PilN
MLRTNLSTRPFYNERVVHVALVVAGLVLVAVTVANVLGLVSLTRRQAEVTALVSEDGRKAEALRREATRLRATIQQDELEAVVSAAREANGLIDLRTFSWTELFNHMEQTLPPDVMLVSVQPSLVEGALTISMEIVGRSVDGIDRFMEDLEATGAFRDVLSRNEQVEEDGSYRAVLIGRYEAVAPAAETPAAAGAPEGRATAGVAGRLAGVAP